MPITLRLALLLPRDASTVPVVRHILDQAMASLGVATGCRDDISLILTEACANVIEHARATDEYEIGVEVTDARCVIDVVHAGAVVDPVRLAPPTDPVLLEESGRGLQIIRALADELYLTPARQGGVILRAIATLHWQPSKPAWDANT